MTSENCENCTSIERSKKRIKELENIIDRMKCVQKIIQQHSSEKDENGDLTEQCRCLQSKVESLQQDIQKLTCENGRLKQNGCSKDEDVAKDASLGIKNLNTPALNEGGEEPVTKKAACRE
eukprot:7706498-Ditylum_brightwellii.AAC.1